MVNNKDNKALILSWGGGGGGVWWDITKHLMTVLTENSKFCFPEILNVLTVSLGASCLLVHLS